jgi:hypothetical protein
MHGGTLSLRDKASSKTLRLDDHVLNGEQR